MRNRKPFKRAAVFLTAAMLAVGCNACTSKKSDAAQSSTPAQSDTDSVDNDVIVKQALPDGVKLALPEGYETVSSEQYEAYYKKGDATVILTEEPFPENCDTLSSYVNRATDQYKAATSSFTLKAIGEFQAAGTTGRYIEFAYRITLADTVLSYQSVTGYLLLDDTAYIITCKTPDESFDANVAAFHEILESAVAVPDDDNDSKATTAA